MIWLLGAGTMAQEYARVLQDLNQEFVVIGRSAGSAKRFTEASGIDVITNTALTELPPPKFAIIATSVNQLEPVTSDLLELGIPNILVEKPGSLTSSAAGEIAKAAKQRGTNLFIAYNRRFYAATLAAQRIIEQDGGPTSWHAELTEWSHRIDLTTPAEVLDRWFIANTSHVVDLAWFLAGSPVDLNCQQSGNLTWHQAGSIFSGSGRTDLGALFSYNGNWQSAGRWSLEISTAKRRLVFRPMELLQEQLLGTINIEEVAIDNQLDLDFKPGLHRQTQEFLAGNHKSLCSIGEQAAALILYERMAGY